MNVPLEIELKLALPPAQAPAFVRCMARRRSVPAKARLATRYFDTPDFALSAAGVALRVRRAGRRWVQTLKTEGERQGGLSQRIEFEMAVKRGELDWTRFPPEALAYVPEVLRGAVVPVFETHFERTAWLLKGKGGAQIEVALDVGEVVAGECRQPLCEIELELKSGRPDALFALALEWAGAFDCLPFDVSKAERGVRLAHGVAAVPAKAAPVALEAGMCVEDGFAAIVQNCLAQFQANLPGVLDMPAGARPRVGASSESQFPPHAKPAQPCPPLARAGEGGERAVGEGASVMPQPINDSEYVHQARVALRRLRAALRLFRQACTLPDALLDRLRALAAALGPARDWDVLCEETLPAIAPHCDDAAAWRRGMQALQAERGAVHASMRAALWTTQPGAWLLAMQRWLQQSGWRQAPEAQRLTQGAPLDAWASRALARGHRRIVRGAREFGRLQAAERHALRIAVKRQRYAAEFFEALYGQRRRQAKYLALLREIQDSLGRANDARIDAALLAGVRAQAGPMGEFARGWLAARQAGAPDRSARRLRACGRVKPYWQRAATRTRTTRT